LPNFFKAKVRVFIFFILSILLRFFPKSKKKINGINLVIPLKHTGLNRVGGMILNALDKELSTKIYHIFKFDLPRNSLRLSGNKSFFFNTNVFIGNPDFLFTYILRKPQFLLSRYNNIALWFWELNKLPISWLLASKFFKEIWVQSDFILQNLNKYNIPTKKIPFVINIRFSNKLNRSYFNIPRNKFCFIFTFDFLSFYQRKNPEAVISAFNLLSETQKNIHLVIKTTNAELSPYFKNKLSNLILGNKNISFIDKTYDDDTHYSLLSICDCYISLHRSEGLGLGLAEAMFLGLPVIGTNYSGNLEFMNKENSLLVDYNLIKMPPNYYPHSSDQYWADPKILHAVELMSKVIKKKSLREKLILNGQNYIRMNHNTAVLKNFLSKNLK